MPTISLTELKSAAPSAEELRLTFATKYAGDYTLTLTPQCHDQLVAALGVAPAPGPRAAARPSFETGGLRRPPQDEGEETPAAARPRAVVTGRVAARAAAPAVNIAIATPAYGQTFYTSYVESLVRLTRAMERRGWASSFASVSYADVAESRNFLLTRWLDKTTATHLLFIDADMGFDPQLVLDMVAFDKPLVGVVAPRRQVDLERYGRLIGEGRPAGEALARAHDFIVRRTARGAAPGRNGFIEVEGCGAGVLLIQRACIAHMLERMPQLSDAQAKKHNPLAKDLDRLIRAFDPLTVDGARLSEDFSFCARWKECGGEVWANIAHEITHVGLFRYRGRYRDAMPRGPRVTLKAGGAAKGKVVTSVAAAAGAGSKGAAGSPSPIRKVVGRIRKSGDGLGGKE
jgi:hypothetical protein